MDNNKAIKSQAYVVEYEGERLAEATVYLREWVDSSSNNSHYFIDLDIKFDGLSVAKYTHERLTFNKDHYDMFLVLCRELRSNNLLDRLYKETNNQRLCDDLETAEKWFTSMCSMAHVGTQTFSIVLGGLTYRSI